MTAGSPYKLVVVGPISEARGRAGRPAKKGRARNRHATEAGEERARRLADFHAWEDSAPTLRTDKVIEAKLCLSRGDYDRDDVREQVLLALLRDLLAAPGKRRKKKEPTGSVSGRATPSTPPSERA